MKTLNPNNRNPKPLQGLKFEDLHKSLMEDGNGLARLSSVVKCGNHREATFRRVGHDDPQGIDVRYHDTIVATLYDDSSVRLHTTGGWDSLSTWKTMDWCLQPLGFRVSRIRRTAKIYSIKTGAYRDYFDGMTIAKGDF